MCYFRNEAPFDHSSWTLFLISNPQYDRLCKVLPVIPTIDKNAWEKSSSAARSMFLKYVSLRLFLSLKVESSQIAKTKILIPVITSLPMVSWGQWRCSKCRSLLRCELFIHLFSFQFGNSALMIWQAWVIYRHPNILLNANAIPIAGQSTRCQVKNSNWLTRIAWILLLNT